MIVTFLGELNRGNLKRTHTHTLTQTIGYHIFAMNIENKDILVKKQWILNLS